MRHIWILVTVLVLFLPACGSAGIPNEYLSDVVPGPWVVEIEIDGVKADMNMFDQIVITDHDETYFWIGDIPVDDIERINDYISASQQSGVGIKFGMVWNLSTGAEPIGHDGKVGFYIATLDASAFWDAYELLDQ